MGYTWDDHLVLFYNRRHLHFSSTLWVVSVLNQNRKYYNLSEETLTFNTIMIMTMIKMNARNPE